MPLRARTRPATAPPAWWGLFASWLALSPPQAARLWHLVSTSADPTVRAWCVTAVYAAGRAQGREQAKAMLGGPLSPKRIVGVLEILVAEGRLSRREATQAEEALFREIDRHGAWT